MRSFPEAREAVQVSPLGGINPKWTRDGHEVLYVGLDGWLMSAAVESGRFAAPVRIVRMGLHADNDFFDPAPDGRRFLIIAPGEDRVPLAPTVLVNWTAKLRD